jgi:nucleoside-diphosphate-sugar epimerase
MKFTVLGSTGFIGSHLVKYIKSEKIECFTPNLRKESISKISNLGHVIYAIGVSDFINHPYDTIEAHVCKLNEVLLNRNFESLTYFSSGRFYYNEKNTSENLTLTVNPLDSDQLYNISKLLGESLCNSSKNSNIKIVRPSNVTGIGTPSNLFVPSIILDAINNNKIILQSTLDSERDYIYIDDLVKIILKIALEGKGKIYNVASGKNTTNDEIVTKIKQITNCTVSVSDNPSKFHIPIIKIKRLQNEFNFKPNSILDHLENIIEYYKNTKL